MSGLLGTLIVDSGPGLWHHGCGSLGGGHTHLSDDLDRHKLPGHPHPPGQCHPAVIRENFEYFHSRINEESYECDSDLNHREHDRVFDYDNFQHEDHHQ